MTPQEHIEAAESYVELVADKPFNGYGDFIALGQLHAMIANVQLQQEWITELHSGLEKAQEEPVSTVET